MREVSTDPANSCLRNLSPRTRVPRVRNRKALFTQTGRKLRGLPLLITLALPAQGLSELRRLRDEHAMALEMLGEKEEELMGLQDQIHSHSQHRK